jgi:hypothetical protein
MSRPASETERRLARASLGFGLAGLVLAPLIIGFVPAAIGFRAGLDNLARRGGARAAALAGMAISAIAGLVAVAAAITLGMVVMTMLLSRSAARQAEEWAGRRVTAFDIALADGGSLGRGELAGKTIFLAYFSPAAPPCAANVTRLEAFAAAHPSAIVVGVAPELEPAAALAWARERGATYPIAAGCAEWPDPLATVAARPALVAIAPNGVIKRATLGPLEDGQLEALLVLPESDARGSHPAGAAR